MESNILIIEKLYRCFAEANYDAVKELFAADIRWEQMEGFPGGSIYEGADEIIHKVFLSFRENWDQWQTVVHNYIDAGQQGVFVQGFYKGTGKHTGMPMRAAFIHHYRLSENKIIQFRQYTDTYLIARAMGKSI